MFLLPIAYRGLLAALTLAFARALGEFGATLMVAGSIPGETETLPLALYAAVQGGKDSDALTMALLLTTVAFVLLGWSESLAGGLRRRGERQRRPKYGTTACDFFGCRRAYSSGR